MDWFKGQFLISIRGFYSQIDWGVPADFPSHFQPILGLQVSNYGYSPYH